MTVYLLRDYFENYKSILMGMSITIFLININFTFYPINRIVFRRNHRNRWNLVLR